jgi:hypothetical protein
MVNMDRASERARVFYEALGFSEGSILHIKLREG